MNARAEFVPAGTRFFKVFAINAGWVPAFAGMTLSSKKSYSCPSGFFLGLGSFCGGESQDDSDSDQRSGRDDPSKSRGQIGQP